MGARVRAYDPIAMPACRKQHPDLKIRYCDSPEELAAGADALVLARSMATPVLVDGRNLFHPEAALAAGFDYTGIGRALPSRIAGSQTAMGS
jgi:UDPglucose 6-dehydrogenase